MKLLIEACKRLTILIARDGEGATKLIEVVVNGARSIREARGIAKNIVNSPLVKTAIHGADPNWGRVVAAAGKDPLFFVNPKAIDVSFGGVDVMKQGEILAFARKRVIRQLQKRDVRIEVNLNVGAFNATAWGCDLTHGYIDINTSYS